METYAKRSEPTARPISARAGHGQPDMATVLQAYRNRTTQFAALTDKDDELVQGKLTAQLQEEEEETLQGKIVAQLQNDEEEETLQGKFVTQLQGLDEEEPLQQKAENRTGLPDRIKNGVESLSGYSLDAVKVHKNSPKPAQLQAYAYTQGTDIHVGPGQERYLGHEAWHVVQQMQGRVKPTTQLQGVAVNDNEGLEREADVMGEKALWSAGYDHFCRNRLNLSTPAVSGCLPVQGGWWADIMPTLAAGAGVLSAALIPGAAPVLALLSGAVDVVKSGYAGIKTLVIPRYNIAAGSHIDIGNCSGTVDGGTINATNDVVVSNGTCEVNISIPAGSALQSLVPGAIAPLAPPGGGPAMTQDSIMKRILRALPSLYTTLGGGTGVGGSIAEWLGAEDSVLDIIAGASSAGYVAGNIDSMS